MTPPERVYRNIADLRDRWPKLALQRFRTKDGEGVMWTCYQAIPGNKVHSKVPLRWAIYGAGHTASEAAQCLASRMTEAGYPQKEKEGWTSSAELADAN